MPSPSSAEHRPLVPMGHLRYVTPGLPSQRRLRKIATALSQGRSSPTPTSGRPRTSPTLGVGTILSFRAVRLQGASLLTQRAGNVTLNEMAYRKGSRDAQDKFAALGAPGAPATPAMAAGGLGAVPPISTAVPGMGAASVKPGAPNQALPTSPVLGTGVPGVPTVAGMGKTQTQGAAIAAPPTAAPATPTTAKAASVFSPSAAPKAAKIPRSHSTVGSNITTETANSVSPSTTPSASPTSSSSSSASSPGGTSSTSPQMSGIVPSTGTSPAATLANETASNTRNQVVSVSGGGK